MILIVMTTSTNMINQFTYAVTAAYVSVNSKTFVSTIALTLITKSN